MDGVGHGRELCSSKKEIICAWQRGSRLRILIGSCKFGKGNFLGMVEWVELLEVENLGIVVRRSDFWAWQRSRWGRRLRLRI